MVLLLVVSFVVVLYLKHCDENAAKYVNPGRFHLRDHVIPGQASYVDGCLGHWHSDDRHIRNVGQHNNNNNNNNNDQHGRQGLNTMHFGTQCIAMAPFQ